jgi:hypothetical protein
MYINGTSSAARSSDRDAGDGADADRGTRASAQLVGVLLCPRRDLRELQLKKARSPVGCSGAEIVDGILAIMEFPVDDDRVVGEVIEDDVVLDRQAAAAGIVLVARSGRLPGTGNREPPGCGAVRWRARG